MGSVRVRIRVRIRVGVRSRGRLRVRARVRVRVRVRVRGSRGPPRLLRCTLSMGTAGSARCKAGRRAG